MNRQQFLLLILGCVAGCSQPVDHGRPVSSGDGAGPPEEVAKLKGIWTGRVLLGDAPGGEVTVEFTDNTIKITRNGTTVSHHYALDPTKNPKWIDLKGSPKSDPPMPTTYGIYELDGDKLKICMGAHSKRPTKFGGGYGTVIGNYTLRRK